VRKLLDDLFPKPLMLGPEIAEVPTPVQEDHSRAQPLGKASAGVSGQVAGVDDRVTLPAEPVGLAQPDRAVPDGGVVRQGGEGTGTAGRQARPEDRVNLLAQSGGELAAAVGILPLHDRTPAVIPRRRGQGTGRLRRTGCARPGPRGTG